VVGGLVGKDIEEEHTTIEREVGKLGNEDEQDLPLADGG
jgi:hypothetical protein